MFCCTEQSALENSFSTYVCYALDGLFWLNLYYPKEKRLNKARPFKVCQTFLRYVDHLRESMGTTDDDEEEEIRKVEVPCCLNIAAAKIAEKKWDDAKKECDKVLEIHETNVKALYRRGQCHLGKKDYDLALADFNKAKELEPNDRGILNEIAKVKKAKLEYAQKEKAMYSKLFK